MATHNVIAVFLILLTTLLANAATTQPIGGNLVSNAGFETIDSALPEEWVPFTAWGEGRAAVEGEVVHAGRHAVRVEGVKPVTQVFVRSAEMQVAAGEKFYASAWVRTDHLVGEVGAVVMADFLNVDGHSDSTARFAVAPKEAQGKWVRVEGVITVPPMARTMHFRVGIWNCSGVAWFDDVELRALTAMSCRIDLAGSRLTPAMTEIPVTLINRAGAKGDVTVRLSAGKNESATRVAFSGAMNQQVEVSVPAFGRGEGKLRCEVERAGRSVAEDEREIMVPAAAVMSVPIPTHWAVEDGPAVVAGEVDLAVTPLELTSGKIHVEMHDVDGRMRAEWESTGALRDGLNQFELKAGVLPVGDYSIVARVEGVELRRGFSVIHRTDAETKLNEAGYLVHGGKAIFPLGIFNGAGKSAEMAEAGFTIQHAYNACDVVEGQRPNDDAALDFLNKAQEAGLQCLFLVPRGFVFANDWEAFRRRVRMFRNHPALLAWDEEEGIARGDLDVKGLAKMCQIIREEDPHHPIMIGDARDEITSIADRATLFPADLMDLGMWWWYPIPPRPSKEGSLLNGDDATNAFELTPPAFLTRATTKKPIWVGVQAYKKEFDWGRYPTPAEYRAQAYIAIIHGAKGLMWYGGYVDGGVFTAAAGESHWDSLRALARELHDLSDVLMAPSADGAAVETPGAAISVSLHKARQRTVLLTANRDRAVREVTIRVPMETGSARVLNESREVAIEGGRLRDHFEGYGVHVYELTAVR